MKLSFGEKIRLKRTRAGLTLEDVAEKLNVHFVTVSRWEREKGTGKELPYKILEKLAAIYDCKVQDLLI